MKVAVIEVKRTGEGDPLEFAVIVRVGDGETRHHVTMVRDTCERLTAGTHTPERCIEAACEFLLDREPKEVAAPVRRLFPRGDQVVPQFEIRPTDYCGHRPAHASKRMPPSMISTRPSQFAFSPNPAPGLRGSSVIGSAGFIAASRGTAEDFCRLASLSRPRQID